MVQNPYQNALLPAPVGGGYSDPDYWIWCGSVVQGDDGAYHMFASRWPKDLGFGANWLFNCEIVRGFQQKSGRSLYLSGGRARTPGTHFF